MIGYVLRERIDPVFSVVVFEIFFASRWSTITWFPNATETMTSIAVADINKSVLGVSETVAMS